MRITLPGFLKLKREEYSDVASRVRANPSQQRSSELMWYMQMYPRWRSFYTGQALEELMPATENPGKDDSEVLRWPVRFNLVKAYCNLYAALLWGRGTTAAEAHDLFDIVVDTKVPGRKEATARAPAYQELLNYWWSYWYDTLRYSGVTQQWAGGCVLKVAWDPWSPNSVYGLQLQLIQPEHFWPIYNPLNFQELLAAEVKFAVNQDVAREKYGLTDAELDEYAVGDYVAVEEHWDRSLFYIRLGKGKHGEEDPGIVARVRNPAGQLQEMEGNNPYPHPVTGQGTIPFVYVPRLRTQAYFGDSLVPDLEGVQAELNKTLADYGDALGDGSHPPVGITDYRGPGSTRDRVIHVPKGGLFNMGQTSPGYQPAALHPFPPPAVPTGTDNFINTLFGCGEVSSGLTPAARGVSEGQASGYTTSLRMLPTTAMLDWERSAWTTGIAGLGGINEIAGIIWSGRSEVLYPKHMPVKVDPSMLQHRQHIRYRPVIPRDRTEMVDEVVRLATVDGVSPREWLRRLGDIENIDKEFLELAAWIAWKAEFEAAIAGRPIEVTTSANPETPAEALPQVSGSTAMPAPKQAATQGEGLKRKRKEE